MELSHNTQLHDSEDNNKIAKSKRRDRLSELPDSLILEILSLLRMKDAVATTILSRFWKNRWTRVPCLHFWYHSFDLHEYRSFINGALAQWNGPKILKFTITFSYFYPRANDLDSWLLFAFEKQVEDLNLQFGDLREADSEYFPTQQLYSCSSITKLSLSYCKMRIEENVNVQWDHLKSLTIVGVNSLSADAMNRVLCGAPILEELIMSSRNISDNFNIRSTSLKYLSIGRQIYCPEIVDVHSGSELRIWAPNLLTLEIRARIYGTIFLDVPSLTKALLYFYECLFEREFRATEMFNQVFQSVRHVESVTLSSWCIKFLVYMKKMKKDTIVQFSNAMFLNLYPDYPAHEMLDVLEMFPKIIILTAKCQYYQKDYSIATKTPPSLHHLKTVEISWSISDTSIFPVTKILLENAHVLEKMVLRLSVCGADQETCQKMFDLAKENVLSMPRSSPTVEVIVVKPW